MNIKWLFILLLIPAFLKAQKVTSFSENDLLKWQKIGIGNVSVTHGQLLLEENEESAGCMILSPQKYEDAVLRFEVMTLNAATVLVALLNASDIGESTNLTIKENSDKFGFWTKEAEDYMFGFRVMAHNSKPFLRKHPVAEGGKSGLGLATKDVMHVGWRHLVECGKKGQHLWLKIDGEIIIDVTDNQALNAGKISVRVRGTAGERGKCLIRNLEIIGEPLN